MLLGGHFPISGGLLSAIDLTMEAGGNTLQIFSKNPGQWRGKPLDSQEARLFIETAEREGISPIVVHDSYLINLAADDAIMREKSIKAFIDEIKRAGILGASYLVTHMGAHKGAGEEKGLDLLARSIARSLDETEDSGVMVLLEVTAGQGTQLGYRLEHLARVIENCGGNKRIGVCLDTCHLFAAGYDISSDEGYGRVINELEKNIGWERIKVIHMNDAKKPLGSKVDRHEHIGMGHIGKPAFNRIVNDPRFENIAMILETPQPEKMHRINMELLKSMKSHG